MSITAQAILSTKAGRFTVRYHEISGAIFVSFTHGDVTRGIPIVRIQSACLFGQSFHSEHCDCGKQLDEAMERVQANSGAIVFSPRGEGKSAGLGTKIRAMELERVADCHGDEAYLRLGLSSGDLREFGSEIEVLRELGVSKQIVLITGNERKRSAASAAGFTLVS